jgi:predicted HTH domain antitoxin
MQIIGIKALKSSPSVLTNAMETQEHLLIRAYADSGLSLGQLAHALGKSYSDVVKLLALLNIPILDYDLADELDTLESLS